MTRIPIPPPRSSGYTATTPHPLYWARWGNPGAPSLLVLHGGPGAHHDYLLPQMLALADEYEMVFYDQRGGGKSKTDSADPITWRTQVDDLALVAAELVSGPVTLVGYSWGGLLAMLYAVAAQRERGVERMPRVVRLVLIDPASVTWEHRRAFEATFAARGDMPWVRAERAALAASGLRESDPDAWRQRSFELSVVGYFADPGMARSLTPFRVASRVQQSVWESLGDFDLRPGLRDLRVPALVVHGREDPIPLASSEEIAAALGARLVVLEGCGHVPYVERPGAVVRRDPFVPAGQFIHHRGVMAVSEFTEQDQPRIGVAEFGDRHFTASCRIAWDGIEYVGRLWFTDESGREQPLPDRSALPGRTPDEVVASARRLTQDELERRLQRAQTEKRRYLGLRRVTDEILARIRYLNQVAISLRVGLLDAEAASGEMDLTEQQMHELVSALRAQAGVEQCDG